MIRNIFAWAMLAFILGLPVWGAYEHLSESGQPKVKVVRVPELRENNGLHAPSVAASDEQIAFARILCVMLPKLAPSNITIKQCTTVEMASHQKIVVKVRGRPSIQAQRIGITAADLGCAAVKALNARQNQIDMSGWEVHVSAGRGNDVTCKL